MPEPTVAAVFAAALLTALATGLGALPFLAVKQLSARTTSLADAAAAGLMLAATFGLIDEGLTAGAERLLLGLALGLLGILAAKRLLGPEPEKPATMSGLGAKGALLLIAVMTAHSFAEGVGVGVAYGDSKELATFITTAIAIHNIPEGLAISLVLVPRGVSVAKAAGWSIFSSLPQPLMAVPSFLLVETFEPLLPIGLGFAAGAMLWMVFAELVPAANRNASGSAVGVAVTVAFGAMLAVQYLLLKG